MDFERLRQIDRLFTYRWDAFIVASLAAGPLRFTALAYEVSMHARTRVPDSTLTRGTERLLRAGLAISVDDGDGHNLYTLTRRGVATAEIIQALTSALAECQAVPGLEISIASVDLT